MQEDLKIIQEKVPSDFPLPTIFTEKEIKEREAKKEKAKLSSETGENEFFLDKEGNLDEAFIINSWYATKGGKDSKGMAFEHIKPEDIQIKNCEQLVNLEFKELFNRPGAFEKMMSQPDNDSKKKKVLDFIVEMVMKTLSKRTREKIKEHNLEEEFKNLITNQAKKDAFLLTNREEMQKEGSGKNEEFVKITLDVAKLKGDIEEILFKKRIV